MGTLYCVRGYFGIGREEIGLQRVAFSSGGCGILDGSVAYRRCSIDWNMRSLIAGGTVSSGISGASFDAICA